MRSRPFRTTDLPEAMVWTAGLLCVAIADPSVQGWTVCPFHWIGTQLDLFFCPGCGLGHAVGFLARGELVLSLRAHPLAIPAVAALVWHVVRLVRGRRVTGSRTPMALHALSSHFPPVRAN